MWVSSCICILIYIHILIYIYIYTCAVATIWHQWSIVLGICRLPIHTTPALHVRCWLLVARSESHLPVGSALPTRGICCMHVPVAPSCKWKVKINWKCKVTTPETPTNISVWTIMGARKPINVVNLRYFALHLHSRGPMCVRKQLQTHSQRRSNAGCSPTPV